MQLSSDKERGQTMKVKKNGKPSKQQETWSPEQLAVMLHVSVRKIYEAISNGQLMAQKVGNNYAISQEAISGFLKTGNPFS